DISARLAAAEHGPPNGDPNARLPAAALRRWIAVRDRRCVFPGCRAPAYRAQTDHTTEHARGGKTIDSGLGSLCPHDHTLRPPRPVGHPPAPPRPIPLDQPVA